MALLHPVPGKSSLFIEALSRYTEAFAS